MKRFRFGLEKLLELRLYAEREAEMSLARAIGEAAALDSRLEALARERVAVAADRFAPGRDGNEMRRAELYLLRLDRTKGALFEAAAKAAMVADAAREVFVEASRDRKVIEKLKEKRKAEYRRSAAQEEIKTMDDISGGAAARRAASDGY